MTPVKPTQSNHYDLVVIGGGVYGSAVLWEAAHRGLQVLMLEKNDFCSGSSANSLKTIHGGIRYLQSLNVKRTIDSDREKVILKTIAPNIVEPLTCSLAATNFSTKSYFSFFAATMMFNALSKLHPQGSGRLRDVFTPSSAQRKFNIFNQAYQSAVSTKGQSCMVWQDAQVTNSEHLPLAFIRSAAQVGGTALNYAEVTNVKPEASQYQITYKAETEAVKSCSASYVVDCSAGPSLLESSTDSADYVAGLNLILSEQFSDYAFALSLNDHKQDKKGLLFFSPWKGSTIAGTWYFNKSEISCREGVDQAVLSVCIRDIVNAFADAGVSLQANELAGMIEDFHLGFLPADLNEVNPEKSIIERAVIKQQGAGYFELRGNKYTTARFNAKKLVDKIAQIDSRVKASKSHLLPLSGVAVATPNITGLYKGSVAWALMLNRYGELASEFAKLIDKDPSVLELVPGSDQIYRIELDYFAQHAHARKLSDVLYRRININVHKPVSAETIRWCAERMAALQSWSSDALHFNTNEVLEKERSKSQLSHMVLSS